uniref:Uncharacterized protein n=1 Tax=viral metagenome TaxID=1070528 RepID=A0A6C0KXD4_9ZZZZ
MALVLMVKLLLAVNPGQDILYNILSPAWRDIYAGTTEYKLALKKML